MNWEIVKKIMGLQWDNYALSVYEMVSKKIVTQYTHIKFVLN